MEQFILELSRYASLANAVILIVLYFLMRLVQEVRDELFRLNGTVGKLKMWSEMHETEDNRRHEEAKEAVRELWSKLNQLQNKDS